MPGLRNLRLSLAHARDRCEGLFFRLACVWLGIPTGGPRAQRLAKTGLREWRLAWWPLFQLERYRDVWRYVLLIEWFVKKGGPKRSAEVEKTREWNRVLVIKLGHFGDTLQAVPLLRALKQSRPGCQVDLLVGPWTVNLVQRIPYIDNIHVYAPHLRHLHRGDDSQCLGLREELKWVRKLQEQKYDLAIVSYTTGLVDLYLLSAIRPAFWLGPNPECALYGDVGQQCVAPFQKGIYEAERLVQLGKLLGIETMDTRLEFPIKDEEEVRAVNLLRMHGMTSGDAWVVICPGAGWPGKQWSTERFAQVADQLIEQMGVRVLICGAPSEGSLATSVRDAMKHDAVNLAGQTGWGELAVLIRDARLFIGNDSGPMHLAAVYEAPCVVLFGPTPDIQWAPRHAGVRVIRHVETCPDCWYWHPDRDCVHDRACMQKITVAEVCAAAMALLEPSRHKESL
jgi:heptosyltransferase II